MNLWLTKELDLRNYRQKSTKDYFLKNIESFKAIYDPAEAHRSALPEPWNSQLDEFEKMIILKAVRPGKLVPSIQDWITLKIGKQFVEPHPFNLNDCFEDANITTSLIFVLSAGWDPVADFLRFSKEKGFANRYKIFIGQGQGPNAERLIGDYSQKGGWVLLQNCHLAEFWMTEKSKLCGELDETMQRF